MAMKSRSLIVITARSGTSKLFKGKGINTNQIRLKISEPFRPLNVAFFSAATQPNSSPPSGYSSASDLCQLARLNGVSLVVVLIFPNDVCRERNEGKKF